MLPADCLVVLEMVNGVGSTPDEPEVVALLEAAEVVTVVEESTVVDNDETVLNVLEDDDVGVGSREVDELESGGTYPQGSVDSKSRSTYRLSFERPPQNCALLPVQRMLHSEAARGTVPFPSTTPPQRVSVNDVCSENQHGNTYQ